MRLLHRALLATALLGSVFVVGQATRAVAQCAPGPLITFEGIAISYEPVGTPTRFAWTFRLTVQPAGLSLPDNVVVLVAHDPPAGSSVTSVEGSLGVPVKAGAQYRVTAQQVNAADGTTTYLADSCGGGYQLQAETTAGPTTAFPFSDTSTRTTVSAEHAARDVWKFVLGGVGILAILGGVLRTATGRQRK